MKWNCFYSWVILFVATTLLLACGFQLRGSNGTDHLPFKTIYIDFPAKSDTALRLKRLIKGMKLTKIVNTPKEAEVILSAIKETRNKETLSLNTQGRVREYSLNYSLNFIAKTPAGKILIKPTQLVSRRTMTYNDSEALSKENEEIMLYKDMQVDMAHQLLRRLALMNMNPVEEKSDLQTQPGFKSSNQPKKPY